MPKFMSMHTMAPGAFTREHIEAMAQAAQNDPVVQPYRSFCCLGEGRAVCVLEGPDKASVELWLRQMNMPTDCVALLELEGDRGVIADA